nr:uncharacterized protein LOC127332337 isoform X2 [Lolium perenne]
MPARMSYFGPSTSAPLQRSHISTRADCLKKPEESCAVWPSPRRAGGLDSVSWMASLIPLRGGRRACPKAIGQQCDDGERTLSWTVIVQQGDGGDLEEEMWTLLGHHGEREACWTSRTAAGRQWREGGRRREEGDLEEEMWTLLGDDGKM